MLTTTTITKIDNNHTVRTLTETIAPLDADQITRALIAATNTLDQQTPAQRLATGMVLGIEARATLRTLDKDSDAARDLANAGHDLYRAISAQNTQADSHVLSRMGQALADNWMKTVNTAWD